MPVTSAADDIFLNIIMILVYTARYLTIKALITNAADNILIFFIL